MQDSKKLTLGLSIYAMIELYDDASSIEAFSAVADAPHTKPNNKTLCVPPQTPTHTHTASLRHTFFFLLDTTATQKTPPPRAHDERHVLLLRRARGCRRCQSPVPRSGPPPSRAAEEAPTVSFSRGREGREGRDRRARRCEGLVHRRRHRRAWR